MDYAGLLSLLKKRRSIKRYKPDPVPDDWVEKIIEAARWAPSGANSQPWEFIVIKDRQTRHKIVDYIMEHRVQGRKAELTRPEELRAGVALSDREPGFKNAPVYIILCGDKRTREAYPLLTELLKGDCTFDSSLASAFLNMHLAAAALGLGSQWVSASARPYVQCMIKDYLNIPEALEIYDMMAVGYAAGAPGPKLLRDLSAMVHDEKYDGSKYRSDEEVRSFIVSLRRFRAKNP